MMEEKLSEQVERCLKSHSRRKNRARVLRVLALVVVFVTVYMLIVPAVTLSNETTCGMEAHTHSEKCYELRMVAPQPEIICGVEDTADIVIHTHDEYCYDTEGNLICTLPEVEEHIHNEDCYQEQRELTCSEAQKQGHTHSDACYARDRGELICGLAEGEGHVHGEGCYTVSGGELICAESEGEGHTHDSSCYTVTETEVLTCTQSESEDVYDEETGELIEAGHTHDASCYTTETTEELTCGMEESGGHTHSESCYSPEVRELTCTIDATGHTHTDECYEWNERLICTEDECESGHVHTEDCYTVTEVLACTEEETPLHVHGEGCYAEDEDGNEVLICEKPVIIKHQHTEKCLSVPEGEPEEKEVLVCGLEEHVHTDECYQEIIPELGEKYFCGLEEHMHEPDCWFDSGELRCTRQEHLHSADCLDPELAGKLPEKETPENAVWIDDVFDWTTEEFHMSFHVQGYAVPEDGGEAKLPVSEGVSGGKPGQEDTERPGDDAEPSSPDGNGGEAEPEPSVEPENVPEPEPTAPAEPEPAQPESGSVPEDGSGAEESNSAGAPADDMQTEAPRGGESAGAEQTGDTGETGNGSAQDSGVVFGVVEKNEDFADISFANVGNGEAEEGQKPSEDGENDPEDAELGETLLKKLITVTAEADGVKLDLSQCEITVEITPTQELLSALEETVTTYDMYYDPYMMEADPQYAEGPAEAVITISDESGNQIACASASEGAQARLTGDSAELTLSSKANPTYTVEYYAYLSTVDSKDGADSDKPIVINTDNGGKGENGKLPQNGETPNTKNMNVETSEGGTKGKIVMRSDVQPVYRTHMYKYASAPGLKYVNIIGNQVMPDKEEGNILPNYKLKEIWVQQGDNPKTVTGEITSTSTSEDGSTVTETVLENGQTRTVTWKKITVTDKVRLTNLALTAQNNPNCILVKDNSVLRLVYETTKDTYTNDANFYDYDITGGKHTGTNYWEVYNTGINDHNDGMVDKKYNGHNNGPGNGSGAAHYAFGNAKGSIDSTAWGESTWTNNGVVNELNKANGNGYSGCTFGIVQGIKADGDVMFSDGIAGPVLFSDDYNADTEKGKRTVYSGSSLTFNRQGDTYTLTAASAGALNEDGSITPAGSVSNLEGFYIRENWDGSRKLWSNYFWPLDSASGSDPKFGDTSVPDEDQPKYYSTSKTGKNFNPSDDGKAHNHFFGMKFAVTFDLTQDYVGPLEYWFFGDDDMWVFLTETDEQGNPTGARKLVCDIGGVHGSVGEYVNLWDYIDPWKNEDGTTSGPRGLSDLVDVTAGTGEGNSAKRKYRLDFFYTERGASGSTCWMQFTLPTLAGINLEDIIKTQVDEDHGALQIRKDVESQVPGDIEKKFKFKLELFPGKDENGNTLKDENGQEVKVDGSYVAYIVKDSGTYKFEGKNGAGTIVNGEEFTLMDGEELIIANLPKGAGYKIYELLSDEDKKNFETTVDTTVEYLENYQGGAKDETVTGPEKKLSAEGIIEGATQTKVHYVNKSTIEVDPPFDVSDGGLLRIEKTVKGVRSSDQFKFHVTLDFSGVSSDDRELWEDKDIFDLSASPKTFTTTVYRQFADGEYNYLEGSSEDTHTNTYTITDGMKVETDITLYDGEAVIFTGLPPGTKYIATEVTDDKLNEKFNVSFINSMEKYVPPQQQEGEGENGKDPKNAVETPQPTAGESKEFRGERTYGSSTDGVIDKGMISTTEFINSSKFMFPETGGSFADSALMYTLAGTLLILAACCLWYKKRPCGKGAAN